jgi:tetratricopeptide (TPR) repeat protein
LAIWRQLVVRNPDISINSRELARCLANLGNLYFGQGRNAEALPPNQEALALRAQLAGANPEVALYQRDLQTSQNRVGQVLEALNRFEDAEVAFKNAFSTCARLSAKHPNIPDYHGITASSLHHLGSVYLNKSDLVRAETSFRSALAAREKQLGMVTSTPFAEYCLADTQASLANVLSERQLFPEAESFLVAAQKSLENLAAKNPDVTDYVGGLGNTLSLRGDHERRQSHNEPALQFYGKAVETLLALRAKNPKADRARDSLINSFYGRAVSLTRLHKLIAALNDWESSLKMAKDDEKPVLLLGQAITIAQQGDHARATSAAEIIIRDPQTAGKLLVQAAAVFAVAVPCALRDDRLQVAEQTGLADRYASRAIGLLIRARALGHFKKPENRASLNDGPEWNDLKKREAFRRFIAEVEDHMK